MRRAPFVSLCAAAALAVAGVVPSATASASEQATERASGQPPAHQPRPSSPAEPAAARAERTLDSVRAALTGDAPQTGPHAGLDEGRDLTLLLRDLRAQLPALRGEDRERAQAYLARPTDGRDDRFADGYGAPGENDCGAGEPGDGTDFCIHWVASTDDAPSLVDLGPANGIPDQVDRTRTTMERVWAQEIDVAGYKEPVRDAGPPDAGPNGKVDIYLSNIGGKGLYGYCAGEPAPGDGNDLAAYCVLDDDYSSREFPFNTPLENLQVTAAHEFFHAVQFAYDTFEDVWLLEGTATWMEDEVFDGVDDNQFYLNYSPLTRPERSLDQGTGLYVYGAWLWWRYLGEQHDRDGGSGIPTIIRRIWEEADDSDADRPGTYSLKAVRRVLANRGSSLEEEFAGFGLANRAPRGSYEEGGSYATAPVARSSELSVGDRSRLERRARLDHLATKTYAFTPGSGLALGGWQLRARVDAPTAKHRPVVQLTTRRANGTATSQRLSLDDRGVGKATVSFDSDDVKQVELTLTNASHRFNCREGTEFSCRGIPRSNNRLFTYTVRLRR